MYEVIEGERDVKNVAVDTFKREVVDANILEVEAGTNGYQGGDTGHGSRTYIRIQDMACTDLTVKPTHNSYGEADGVTLELGGDAELATIIEAMKFIVKVLEEQSRELE